MHSSDYTEPNKSSMPNIDPEKRNGFAELDAFIKFILAVSLAALPFFVESQPGLAIIVVYLILVTTISGIKSNALLISAASYAIIVLIPFFFGLIVNQLLYSLTDNQLFTFQQSSTEIFLRLFRLFVIWYVSILYFHTTPTKAVIGMLDKLLFPLKLIGVPIKDYLKVVMCIVLELKEKGTESKNKFVERLRSGETGRKISINIKGLSQIIISLLVNSFENLDRIEDFVGHVKAEDLYYYRFKVNPRDMFAILSFLLLVLLLWKFK